MNERGKKMKLSKKQKKVQNRKNVNPKPILVNEVIIQNTFGVTKYLDDENYKKVSNSINDIVKRKAEKLGWKKFRHEVSSDVIKIVKG